VTTVSGIPGDGHEAPPPKIRYFKTPRKRRRWPWVIFYAVWMMVGLVAAVAWGVDRAAQHLLDQISPNNSTVIAARKVLVKPTGPDTTFIILGSDHRSWVAGSESLSDSMILVRLSPRQNLISIMSVPRDLKVTIPGYAGYQKINAAYSLGGPKLSIQTAEQNLGVSINHFVNVGFQGFFQIVQHLGGLYTQVDRRYYNPLGTGYSPIDLQPGYQILNGNQALAFARFRHTDTDIVRAARQQQIIIDLKRQASEKLGITDVPLLLNTIAGSIETDVHSLSQLINIGEFLIGLPHGRIFHTTLQVSFDTTPGQPAYDLASPQQVQQSVYAFMNPLAVAGRQISSTTVTAHPAAPAKTATATPGTAKPATTPASAKQAAAAAAAAANRIPSGLVVSAAPAAALKGLGGTGLPLLVPSLQDSNSQLDSVEPVRAYTIPGGPNGGWASVVEVFANGQQAGSYYDIQETRLPSPPVMQSPTSKIYAGARTYDLFQDGSVLRYDGFWQNHTWYWISNTFSGALTPAEMVGIAASLQPASHAIAAPKGLGLLTHGLT
jgi:LCP family protein required for cell wall assembly